MILDEDFLEDLQYALLEPPDGGASWPSGLWTPDEVRQTTNQRQDRLLKETHLLTQSAVLIWPALAPRVALPVDWMATLEVVWRDDVLDPVAVELQRSDVFEIDHALPTWATTPTQPQVYGEFDTPTLELQIAPVPVMDGTVTLRYVAQSSALVGEGGALALPDEWAPVVKYGVLADLLGKDGRAHDPARASYSLDRFALGIDLTRMLLGGQS